MKIPENIIDHIRNEAQTIRFGRIILEINETSKSIDVVTEVRDRFSREEQPKQNTTSKELRMD